MNSGTAVYKRPLYDVIVLNQNKRQRLSASASAAASQWLPGAQRRLSLPESAMNAVQRKIAAMEEEVGRALRPDELQELELLLCKTCIKARSEYMQRPNTPLSSSPQLTVPQSLSDRARAAIQKTQLENAVGAEMWNDFQTPRTTSTTSAGPNSSDSNRSSSSRNMDPAHLLNDVCAVIDELQGQDQDEDDFDWSSSDDGDGDDSDGDGSRQNGRSSEGAAPAPSADSCGALDAEMDLIEKYIM